MCDDRELRRRKKTNIPAIKAINANGIVTPIAAFALVESEDPEGVDAEEVELVEVGVVRGDEVVGEEEEEVGVIPSKASIWTSVLCHSTGIPSHTAEVSFGTVQVVRSRASGRSIVMLGVG